jgi:hypothetical protein
LAEDPAVWQFSEDAVDFPLFAVSKSTLFTRHPYRGGLAIKLRHLWRSTMCPVCLATMGLIFAGAASAGGLTALAVKVSLKKNGATEIAPNSNERRNEDVDEHGEEPENSVA